MCIRFAVCSHQRSTLESFASELLMADQTSFQHSFVKTWPERSHDVFPADGGQTDRHVGEEWWKEWRVWSCGCADKQMVGKWADRESDRHKDRWAAHRQTDGLTNEARPVWKLDVDVKVAKFRHFFFFFFSANRISGELFLCFASIHSDTATSRVSSSVSPSTFF